VFSDDDSSSNRDRLSDIDEDAERYGEMRGIGGKFGLGEGHLDGPRMSDHCFLRVSQASQDDGLRH
jgi:hypothetical protein